MGRSPKSYSHRSSGSNQKSKRRRDSSSPDSDNDRQRYQRRHRDDNKSQSNVPVKQEPMTDDDSRRQRPNKSFEPRRNPREKDDKSHQWGKQTEQDKQKEAPVEKEKPNFSVSGALLKDTNTYKGFVIKYSEPIEARKPKRRWRLYVFKGEQELPMYQIHRQSAYLIGRERAICDLPIDHPSCSSQHAVLQYRLMDYKRDDGSMGRRVVPYIIDLGSANGTFLNNQKIDPQRYYELRENDVIKFGYSTREYVLLHEDSANNVERISETYEDEGVEIKKEPVEPPKE
jgi:smad nuclear-interacting protein 1